VLACFGSCLVLGMAGGHLLALDLAPLHCRKEVREVDLHHLEQERDDYDPDSFAAMHPDPVPCIAHNSSHHQHGRFSYRQDPGGSILLPEKTVHVTALAYTPQLDALVVGFNFGTLQLWSLTAERLLYSSPIGEGGLATKVPVSHFLFQDSNQPAGLVHLWVGRSAISSPLHSLSQVAEVQLLKIKFKDAASVQITSEYRKPFSTVPVAKIIDILLLDPREQNGEAEDVDEENEVGGMARMPWALFVWEVDTEDAPKRVHMGLFNIDLAATTGFVSLAYPFQKEKACLALHVDPASISDFFACTKGLFPEERDRLCTYAASNRTLSLSFDVACLYVDAYTCCSWLSDQEKALDIFAQPTQPWVDQSLGLQTTYQNCKSVGLLATLSSDGSERDYRFQYRALFDMCLRKQLSACICTLATLERDDGSYLFTNPRVILEWAWDKYSAYDTALNDPGGSLYLSTLSVGNQQEESAFSAQLRTMAGRLSGLQHVFQALLSRHDNTTKGQRNLEDKYQCVVHTLQHLKVMMWVRAKIENWMFLGDSKTLQAQFQKRKDKRKEIHANTEQWLACQQEGKKKMEEKEEDESKRGTATSARLFIELLLDAFPSEQPLHYPPHNMSNFLRILFASAHPEPLKHSIVYYYLRDLVGWGEIYGRPLLLEEYARCFHLDAPYRHLMEGLWGLDCGSPEDIRHASNHLAQVSGEAALILKDWSGQVLRALYDARAWSYALRFMRWMDPPAVSCVEVILHLQILLENHLPSHAFNLQRECSSDSLRRTLLGQIFEFFAHRRGTVIDVLKLHLDAAEEEAFISYLTVSLKELGLEQLVHYFLQRGRYNEAMRAYKDLTSQLSLDRLASLDFLIQNYKLALPSVALPETSPSISHNPRPTSPTLPSTFSASERVLFPMSPFGGPPSLRSPKPGWRSGKSSNLPPQIEPEMPSTDETKQAPPAPRPAKRRLAKRTKRGISQRKAQPDTLE